MSEQDERIGPLVVRFSWRRLRELRCYPEWAIKWLTSKKNRRFLPSIKPRAATSSSAKERWDSDVRLVVQECQAQPTFASQICDVLAEFTILALPPGKLDKHFESGLWLRYGDSIHEYKSWIEFLELCADKIKNARQKNADSSPLPSEQQFYMLYYTFGRALQVAREVGTLIQAGYPEGAGARARTLLEIGVTLDLLKDADHDDLLSYGVTARTDQIKFLESLKEHGSDLTPSPVGTSEIEELIQELRAEIEKDLEGGGVRYGAGPFSWSNRIRARRNQTSGERRNVSFTEALKDSPYSHWVPYYIYFNQPTHGGMEAIWNNHAITHGTPVFAVGTQDGGFVDIVDCVGEWMLVMLKTFVSAVPAAREDPDVQLLVKALTSARDSLLKSFLKVDPLYNGEASQEDADS